MSPCRKQNDSRNRRTASGPPRPAGPSGQAAPRRQADPARASAASAAEPAVCRYPHPIRAARPMRRSPTEILLREMAEGLRHQTELLEELLRRTQ